MKSRPLSAGLASVLLLTIGLSACGKENADVIDDGPWAADLKLLYDQMQPGFQRDVISDGEITEEELLESEDRFRKCVEQQGIAVEFNFDHQNGGFSWTVDNSADQIALEVQVAECERQHYVVVGGMYWMIKLNPENEDQHERFVDCVNQLGLNPNNVTVQQLNLGDIDFISENFPQDDPRVSGCLMNPNLTLEQADTNP